MPHYAAVYVVCKCMYVVCININIVYVGGICMLRALCVVCVGCMYAVCACVVRCMLCVVYGAYVVRVVRCLCAVCALRRVVCVACVRALMQYVSATVRMCKRAIASKHSPLTQST